MSLRLFCVTVVRCFPSIVLLSPCPRRGPRRAPVSALSILDSGSWPIHRLGLTQHSLQLFVPEFPPVRWNRRQTPLTHIGFEAKPPVAKLFWQVRPPILRGRLSLHLEHRPLSARGVCQNSHRLIPCIYVQGRLAKPGRALALPYQLAG